MEKVAEAPATALDKTIEKTANAAGVGNLMIPGKKIARGTRNYWHNLGPGLTDGAADDDPSGIATYSQTGAQYGLQLLWLSAFTFPMMAFVQEMCARIGLVTGRGLAGSIRVHFSKKVLYICTILLFFANTFNIGADLGAMAKAAQLMSPGLNFGVMVLAFAVVSLGLQIFTPYAKYAKYLKYLALVLLAYVASAIMAHLDWNDVLHHAFIPHINFSKDQILLICAILGTTISPYLFFWQTSQEVEEQISGGNTTLASRQGTDPKAIRKMRVDVWSGMFLSNMVMFFIIAVCGATLFSHGITNIQTASDAAEALRPFAGNASYWLFSLGIIGTGLLAIPVLAGSSSYAIGESMKWKGGLNQKLGQARSFYGIIMISVIIGFAINFVGLDPIKALIYSAVLNGITAPIILATIVIISSNKKVMGEWANRRIVTYIGWLVTILMTIAGTAAIFTMI